MSTQRTPGPWTAAEGRDDCAIKGADGRTVGFAQTDFDARLIAAAPDLLEALYNALPYVDDVLADKDQLACFKPGVVQAHAKAIRAAIAKATGEQA